MPKAEPIPGTLCPEVKGLTMKADAPREQWRRETSLTGEYSGQVLFLSATLE